MGLWIANSFGRRLILSKSCNYVWESMSSGIHFSAARSNHYETLGVRIDATQEQIKEAYYRQSKQFHPDKTRGNIAAEEKFRGITEAYEVIANPEARKTYNSSLDFRDYSPPSGPVSGLKGHSIHYTPMSPKTTTDWIARDLPISRGMDVWTQSHYSKSLAESFWKNQAEVDKKTEAYARSMASRRVRNWPINAFWVVAIILVGVFNYLEIEE